MPEHPRTMPIRTFTIYQAQSDFIDSYSAHRELSASHLMREMINHYRASYDPTYTSPRRLTAPNRYGSGM